ncbi:YlxQ-related RNA-binding protein [uncultured Limosilactobacillus sp.]|uniref:YlxQ-related RNA-binding protein n=1 Tax=uncultured Limosilactobacillus sp. TaxID=2837629 RepID=UPI0025E538CA|nr:YlxQ-related RNA-binding protein [uncultured Limosilactobacillus sp.]
MINIDQKILNLLGIARRAGELVTGEEMVLKSIQHGQTKLVFLAQDAGTTTQKKFRDKCQSYQVTLCQRYTRAELSQAIGQSRSVLAITQMGFTKKMNQLLNQN